MSEPEYIEKFTDDPRIFELLMGLDWLEVTEARKEYFMSEEPRSYDYGKEPWRRTYHSKPFTARVQLLMNDLNYGAGLDYNVCFLNRYDTQVHQLGWHADDSPEMDGSHPIAVVSFGAERDIWWRPKGFTGVIPAEWRQRLASGSCFIMPAGFQDTHQHRIPKCDRPCGTRISLTFRRYKPAGEKA